MTDNRPGDLIPVNDAARLVDRSVSSLRGWVRTGQIKGYREDPAHPENSRLLLSRSEILQLARESKHPSPGRPSAPNNGSPTSPAPKLKDPGSAVLTAELEGARALLEALKSQVALLEARCRTLEEQVRTERQRAEEWKGRATVVEAELNALKDRLKLPLWRRLLPGPLR